MSWLDPTVLGQAFLERARVDDQPGLLELALVDFLCHLQRLAGCPMRHNERAVEIADDDVAGTDLDATPLATTRVGRNATMTNQSTSASR